MAGRASTEAGPSQGGRGQVDDLQLRPLTARSVILSVLLGSHPPQLPVRSLVRTGEIFGISEGTTRVALSRLSADGDVTADRGRYRLSERLAVRQQRLDEGLVPPTRPWRGAWEVAVVSSGARGQADRSQADRSQADRSQADRSPADRPLADRPLADRSGLGPELEALRLAELRPGVWVRPANLRRPWPAALDQRVWRFTGHPPDATVTHGELVATLWDVGAWSGRADTLLAALKEADEPARRFMIAAAMLRHLQADPLLPPALLPAGWPGRRLRAAYDQYVAEMQRMLRQEWLHGEVAQRPRRP